MAEPMSPALEAATIAKLEAEAARARADAERLALEARVAAVDAREAERDEQMKLAANRYHRVYTFNGVVGDSTVKACMDQIDVWRRNDPGCDVEIVFNSPGGDVIAGLALWDYLQALRAAGHKLTTVSYGYAASMAGILLQAGDERVIGKESWLMIHEASFGSQGKTSEVEDRVEWVKRVQERILDIFAARSHMSKRAIKNKWARKDWWLSSDEALKAGFVDSIR